MGLLLRSLATLVATIALSFSAVSYAEKPKWANQNDASIVEFAVGASGEPFDFDDNSGDFDVLVAALIATGVVEAFDGTDLTVFAPNDNAFYMLTGTDNDTDAFNAVLSLLSEEEIAAVLAYHVTPDVRNSRSVTRAKMIVMLGGNMINFEGGLIIATNSEAGLLDTDNRLSDGMVHVIDTVLLP
ncbi:fasciclin [Vibrio campbellii]|uniref:fasciclin domain-containing protein n=1 Tax=Vibrio campbellii TaxID=680 RepID=UPI000CF4C4F0|nr:fasciclin domain-containing protein [Vibrio campbellii]PQJ43261.1 fasciclin [Vibrio campbellii]